MGIGEGMINAIHFTKRGAANTVINMFFAILSSCAHFTVRCFRTLRYVPVAFDFENDNGSFIAIRYDCNSDGCKKLIEIHRICAKHTGFIHLAVFSLNVSVNHIFYFFDFISRMAEHRIRSPLECRKMYALQGDESINSTYSRSRRCDGGTSYSNGTFFFLRMCRCGCEACN